MNPFAERSSKHNTWPVILIIYNLPPWIIYTGGSLSELPVEMDFHRRFKSNHLCCGPISIGLQRRRCWKTPVKIGIDPSV
jgi:hypothetical protein